MAEAALPVCLGSAIPEAVLEPEGELEEDPTMEDKLGVPCEDVEVGFELADVEAESVPTRLAESPNLRYQLSL
jgi:hypothetical protein